MARFVHLRMRMRSLAKIITLFTISACTAGMGEAFSSHDDAIAKNGNEIRYVDAAWHISPAIGLLRSRGFGAATLIRLAGHTSSRIVVTNAHLFANEDWSHRAPELPHLVVFTIPKSTPSSLPQSYVDVIVPLVSARVMATSQDSAIEQDYQNDIAVGQLAYQLGPEHLGLQPIPTIAEEQPPASPNLHAWFIGYGANRCEDDGQVRVVQGGGTKRAASFEWPGPERYLFFLERQRLAFDRRTQVAPCPMDSGGPYLIAGQSGASEGYVGTWPHVTYQLDTMIAIAAAAQLNNTNSDSEWGPTYAADVIGHRAWIETFATETTEPLPSLDALTRCPALDYLSPHGSPLTTQSFCNQVQNLDAYCASATTESACAAPYCDWHTCHNDAPRCVRFKDTPLC